MLGWQSRVGRLLHTLVSKAFKIPRSSLAPPSDSASDSSEHWELISSSGSQGSNTVPDSTAASSPWWLRPPPSTLPFYLADSAHKLRAECGYSGLRRLDLAFQRGLQASRIRKKARLDFSVVSVAAFGIAATWF